MMSSNGSPRAPAVFGVDISHYTADDFPIEDLQRRSVSFVYMKASQGRGFVDSKFRTFWSRAGALSGAGRVHRGAYHFLSAADAGADQAATFMRVLKANGGLKPTDMPPVVDLEWDKASATGPDRWNGRSPEQILNSLKAFLQKVEAETGRKPVIYTARAWWRERMGSEARYAGLTGYPLWIADYSRTSRASETPRSPNSAPWALWQYTDSATMAVGYQRGFDANIHKGPKESFYQARSVQAFQ